jgi:hypothetical protein
MRTGILYFYFSHRNILSLIKQFYHEGLEELEGKGQKKIYHKGHKEQRGKRILIIELNGQCDRCYT